MEMHVLFCGVNSAPTLIQHLKFTGRVFTEGFAAKPWASPLSGRTVQFYIIYARW